MSDATGDTDNNPTFNFSIPDRRGWEHLISLVRKDLTLTLDPAPPESWPDTLTSKPNQVAYNTEIKVNPSFIRCTDGSCSKEFPLLAASIYVRTLLTVEPDSDDFYPNDVFVRFRNPGEIVRSIASTGDRQEGEIKHAGNPAYYTNWSSLPVKYNIYLTELTEGAIRRKNKEPWGTVNLRCTIWRLPIITDPHRESLARVYNSLLSEGAEVQGDRSSAFRNDRSMGHSG
jgi:hypothetical protein